MVRDTIRANLEGQQDVNDYGPMFETIFRRVFMEKWKMLLVLRPAGSLWYNTLTTKETLALALVIVLTNVKSLALFELFFFPLAIFAGAYGRSSPPAAR